MGSSNLSAAQEYTLLTAIGTKLDALIAASGGAVALTYTERSSTIAAGGVSQQLAAANATRTNVTIQNPTSEVESLFVNFGAAAAPTGTSIEITPGGIFVAPTTQAINVIAATTGHKYVAKELAP